jgi:uncharacterized repeat protein (TIGR02543 family)
LGWYDNGGFTGDPVTTIPVSSTGNKTFYAKWSNPTAYTITYNNLNGGSNNAANPAAYTVEDLPLTLAAPSRTGYTFGGWYDNGGFTGDPVTSIPGGSTGDKIFYAKWTPASYTITYTLNGGSNNAANPAAYTVEDPAITLAAPARAGYTFGGWYDNDEFTESPVAAIPALSVGDKNFYAQWTLDSYSITYNNLNGASNPNPANYTVESSAITLAAPVHGSYRFDGWYDNTAFSGNPVASIPAGSTGDKTFYAKWNPPAPIQITLQPAPSDPLLTNELISVNQQAIFNAGTGYAAYTWYWDGALIIGETSSSYTLAANSKPEGIYELSVVITDNAGERLSARCRVIIKVQ